MVHRLRCVVTGKDAAGKSAIVSDGPPTDVVEPVTGMFMAYLWRTLAPAGAGTTAAADEARLEPPPGATTLIAATFPPAAAYGEGDWSKVMETVGGPPVEGDAVLHKTATVDYSVVVSGEIYVVLEQGETRLGPGDVLVQNGTLHSWENRSDQPCLMVGVMVGKAEN